MMPNNFCFLKLKFINPLSSTLKSVRPNELLSIILHISLPNFLKSKLFSLPKSNAALVDKSKSTLLGELQLLNF